MSMLQKIITSGTTPTYPSMWYHHDTNWSAKAVTTAADRYTLQSPDAIQVDVGGTSLTQYSGQILDLSLDTNWDFGQNVGTWTAEHTYAVGDLVRATHVWGNGTYNTSTAWATLAATSATQPYIITATTESATPAWGAFTQGGTSDRWRSVAASTGNLMINLGVRPKIINRYIIRGSNDATDWNTLNPKTWQLQGTNNTAAAAGDAETANGWTTLDSQTNQTFSAVNAWSSYYTFTNSTSYQFYRLRITANNGFNNLLDVGQLKLISAVPLVFRASAITTGISDATEPSWAVTGDTTDSGVTWTAYTDYTNAQNRAGQDFYVYSVARSEGSIPKLIASANATYPINYNASTSRKIAGFHCLSSSVGTVAGNSLTGYVTGDILPLSVWDLHKRSQAVSGNVGQVYNPETSKWAGIYPVSGSKTAPTIVYGGTILVSTDWNDSVDAGKVLGMSLPSDAGFQSQAAGSNEQTVISGVAMPSPATTIGYVDSAGTRMISNIGCESCCGLVWSWLDEQSYQFRTPVAHTHQLVINGAITGATVAAGGTGYSVNDVLTVVSATGINGTVTVATVDAGAVLTVTVTTAGTLYTNAGNPHAVTVGGGADCTLTITTAATKTSAVASADVAPAWGWQAASGSKGSIYRQGTTTGGDVKVLAGGDYEGQSFDTLAEAATKCGSRARDMGAARWSYNARIGVRLIANSIEK